MAARSRQAGDQTELDGVIAHVEDDGNRRRYRFGHERRSGTAASDNDRDAFANQIARQSRQPVQLVLGPAVLNRDVLALGLARFLQALPKSGKRIGEHLGRLGMEKADRRYRLLRPHRERPRSSAAEQRDELAASHSITSSARASSVGGISTSKAFAVAR